MALQVGDVGVPREEPQQFMDDRLEMQLLGGQQREALGEVEAPLVADQALGAGAGAVALVDALGANPAQEVEVLFHGCCPSWLLRSRLAPLSRRTPWPAHSVPPAVTRARRAHPPLSPAASAGA